MSRVFLPVVSQYTPPRLRLGVSIAHTRSHEWRDTSLRLLNPPLWKDWLHDHLEMPGYLPHVFSIKPSSANMVAIIKAANDTTGKIWELGNEPELAISPVAPAEAAAFCRAWQDKVGDNFAAPGIIVHPPGLDWLEQYLQAGGPVGRFWNIHIYFCIDGKSWQETWNTWCAWMKAHDLVRPTIVSETCGMFAHVGLQKEVMARIVKVLESDPLLHSVIWYSDNDWWKQWPNSNLRTDDGQLTELGLYYRALTA